MASIKVMYYVTSFDDVVVERYVNKQKDEKSLVLQHSGDFIRFCLRNNCCGC